MRTTVAGLPGTGAEMPQDLVNHQRLRNDRDDPHSSVSECGSSSIYNK